MELDILVCIPQLAYQKIFRLDSLLIKLNEFEVRIRKSVVLPSQITFHAQENQNSHALDMSQSLRYHGFNCFNNEPQMLYIYFSELSSHINNNKNNLSQIQDMKDEKSSVPIQEEVKKRVITSKRKIIVTILNPYLATNHTFVAKNKLKLSELLEEYQKRIKWKTHTSRLFFTSYPSKVRHNLSQTLDDITLEDEITLEIRKESGETKDYKKVRNVIDLRLDNDGLEIIEKKFKQESVNTMESLEKSKAVQDEQIKRENIDNKLVINVQNNLNKYSNYSQKTGQQGQKLRFLKNRCKIEDGAIEVIEDDLDFCTRFFMGKLFSGETDSIDGKILLDFILRNLYEEDGVTEKNSQFGAVLKDMENRELIKLEVEFVNQPLREDPHYFRFNTRITGYKILAIDNVKGYFVSYYENILKPHRLQVRNH